MNLANPTNRIVWPKIHLREGFISISTSDWKPKIGIKTCYIIFSYIILAKRIQNLKRVVPEFLLESPHENSSLPASRAALRERVAAMRGLGAAWNGSTAGRCPDSPRRRLENKCKGMGIKLFMPGYKDWCLGTLTRKLNIFYISWFSEKNTNFQIKGCLSLLTSCVTLNNLLNPSVFLQHHWYYPHLRIPWGCMWKGLGTSAGL